MAKKVIRSSPSKAAPQVATLGGVHAGFENDMKPTSPHDATMRNTLLKKAIVDTAARLFSIRGFSGTNIRDIAEELNISRPAVYYYFKKKEDILEELIEEVTFSIERESRAIVDHDELNPKDAIGRMIRSLAHWLLEHGTHFRVVEQADEELLDDLRARHRRAKRAVLDNVTDVISRGIDTGCFRPVDAQVAAFSIIGMCNWTAWWFKLDGARSAEEVADQIADLAVQSLLRPDASELEEGGPIALIRKIEGDLGHLSRMIEN